ncbi:MAG: cytochrome c oxidase assembly protein [Rhodospirillaceae bacterium]|nr:cytochrome c oxidase assembly protein [Rhodospirillales bacterium]
MAAPSHRNVVLVSLAALAAMIGLVVLSVPLYQMFCRVTGYGGTTRIAIAAPGAVTGRPITVRFDSSVAKDLPWRFQPNQREIKAHLGEQMLATYTATNTGTTPIIGTATFNVTPDKAGRYFNKIACFCFTEQRLEPGQSVDMPVTFFVDPSIADDPYANEVTTITLSYTFFKKVGPS